MTVAERDRTADEIAPAVQEALIKHPGKWAALTRTEVLAIEATPDAAYRIAREKGVETPILYHVPDRNGTYYY